MSNEPGCLSRFTSSPTRPVLAPLVTIKRQPAKKCTEILLQNKMNKPTLKRTHSLIFPVFKSITTVSFFFKFGSGKRRVLPSWVTTYGVSFFAVPFLTTLQSLKS
eukprot:EG_transcript_42722